MFILPLSKPKQNREAPTLTLYNFVQCHVDLHLQPSVFNSRLNSKCVNKQCRSNYSHFYALNCFANTNTQLFCEHKYWKVSSRETTFKKSGRTLFLHFPSLRSHQIASEHHEEVLKPVLFIIIIFFPKVKIQRSKVKIVPQQLWGQDTPCSCILPARPWAPWLWWWRCCC